MQRLEILRLDEGEQDVHAAVYQGLLVHKEPIVAVVIHAVEAKHEVAFPVLMQPRPHPFGEVQADVEAAVAGEAHGGYPDILRALDVHGGLAGGQHHLPGGQDGVGVFREA